MSETDQNNNEPTTIIFTDGASRGNPGPGGYGVVIVSGDTVTELGGSERETTNNRMELRAAIEALRYLKENHKLLTTDRVKEHGSHAANYRLTIYTDSSYVLKGITRWVHGWQKNGWKTKSGDAVKNADLWQELAELAERFTIDWQLLEGHVGVAGNERADEIATAYADGKKIDLFNGPLGEYEYNVKDVSRNKLAKETKESSKKGKSGKAYSYVSMVQGEIKTHDSWSECEKRVKGKNAWFRKATSKEHEKEIIDSFRGA